MLVTSLARGLRLVATSLARGQWVAFRRATPLRRPAAAVGMSGWLVTSLIMEGGNIVGLGRALAATLSS